MIRGLKPYRTLFPLVLLILLILSSCTDGGAGIFYSIEIEEEIVNRSLPDYLTAFSYATINNRYYLAGGGLYTWDSNNLNQEWSDMSLPSGWKYTWQVASYDDPMDTNDTLYAILENSDGDRTALYTWDGANWQGPYPVGVGRPYRLWYVDDTTTPRIYVGTQQTANEEDKDYNYRLYTAPATNLSSFDQVQVGASIDFYTENAPIRDLAAIDINNVFFITSGLNSGSVYNGTVASFNIESTPASRYLRNLHYSEIDTNGLYLSASDQIINGNGYIYKWNGANWDFVDSVGDDPNDFGDFDVDGDGEPEFLLIGTEDGYFESSNGSGFSGESATIDSSAEYEITDLSSSVIQGLFDVPGENIFFAMTSGNGLWRNTSGTWSRE